MDCAHAGRHGVATIRWRIVMPKISVLLTAAEGERLDSYCRKTGHKKSTLVAKLLRDHLEAAISVEPEQPPSQIRTESYVDAGSRA